MPYRLTPDPNYALGHEAVLKTGRRYEERAREILGRESIGMDEVVALGYVQGLIDMADLYARATYASSVETKLADIEAHIEELLTGGVGE